jgi:hypothetical protein
MKHSAWNPVRRNKNIGTSKSGYKENNKFVVPDRWCDYRVFWERLIDPVVIPLEINTHEITLLVEPVKEGYIHACTPADITKVLELIKVEHLEEIELIVFRQPKKKEEILKPVWGRFIYYADIGKYSGPGVYLEAVPKGKVMKWGNKLDSYDKKELRSLEKDGHKIERVKRGYNIHTTSESVRNTQLFRTLPHEIGHAVDYLYHSLRPSVEAVTEAESDYISEAYNSKPSLDKEEFAHRYAREFYDKFRSEGVLPFERLYNEQSLKDLGLNEKWFHH